MIKTVLKIFGGIGLLVALLAQTSPIDGTAVRISGGPNDKLYTCKYAYSSNILIYKGCAARDQPTFSWTVAGSTLTSIVDSSNTATVTTSSAHGLAPRQTVTIAGNASDEDLNGTYSVLAVGSTTTFTVTTASVTDTTYNTAPLAVTTTAPRTTASIWQITFYEYTSTDLTGTYNSGLAAIWDNRAVVTGTTKVELN